MEPGSGGWLSKLIEKYPGILPADRNWLQYGENPPVSNEKKVILVGKMRLLSRATNK